MDSGAVEECDMVHLPPRSTSPGSQTISSEPFPARFDSAVDELPVSVSRLLSSGGSCSYDSQSQRARENGFGGVTGEVVKPCYSRWRHGPLKDVRTS